MNYRKGVLGLFLCTFIILLGVSADGTTHIVQRGETIYGIARAYNVDQAELLRLNGISDPSKIQPGQSLRIPGVGQQISWNSSYRVVNGDTLYGLAREYGVSVDDLRNANGFSSSYVLKIGDVIIVPGTAGSGSAGQAGSSPAVPDRRDNGTASSLRWPVNVRELNYMTGRPGVEITGERAEPVLSLTRGMVISAGPFRDYGRVAIVQVEGGYYYVYGGCETLLVKEGDRVGPGTELGRLGIDSASGKPLLKFLVYRSNTPIDPANAPRA